MRESDPVAGQRAPRRRRAGPLRWTLRALAALVLLELALQVAAPVVRWIKLRDGAVLSANAPLTVLCVGDSHTFGLGVPQIGSYPERLATRLDARFTAPVSVVNRGVPGQNSAQVTSALPADLRAVDPDIVLILAGINDTWNRDAESGGSTAWLGHIRLVKLVRVLLAGVTTAERFEVLSDAHGQIAVDRGQGARPVNTGAGAVGVRSGDELRASVTAQLRRALDLVRESGARPVLMTYTEFQGEFATVNQAVRDLARVEGVLLVDHERDFTAHFAQQGYETLMLNDHHPNARGYALVAQAIDRELAAAGCVPPALTGGPPPDDAPPAQADVTAELSLDADGRLRLAGPPDWPFQLLVAAPAGDGGGFDFGARHIPLQDDALLALSRIEPSFSGRLDSGGVAVIAVPTALRQAGAGAEWAACLVLLAPTADAPPIAAVSPIVRLRL